MCEEWTIAINSGYRKSREDVIAVDQTRGDGDLVLGSGSRDGTKEDISEFSSALVVTVSSHVGWVPYVKKDPHV